MNKLNRVTKFNYELNLIKFINLHNVSESNFWHFKFTIKSVYLILLLSRVNTLSSGSYKK